MPSGTEGPDLSLNSNRDGTSGHDETAPDSRAPLTFFYLLPIPIMEPITYERKVLDIIRKSLQATSEEFWPQPEPEKIDNEWMWREKL